jgi:6-phosphofructokinase 2
LGRRSAIVCVSLADRGAIFAAGDHVWFARAPRVKSRGTVGAGDSMVGAMTTRLVHWGLTQPDRIGGGTEEKLMDVFQWGLAAGAATASTEGTQLGTASVIRRLRGKVLIQNM